MFSGYRGSITKPPPGTPIDPFHPLSQGSICHLLMNEGSGSRVYDISGHGNHGTLKNMSPNAQNSGWGGSKFGGGLKFDGDNDYVDCGSGGSLLVDDAVTVELWKKGGVQSNYHTLAQGVNARWSLYYSGGNLYFWIRYVWNGVTLSPGISTEDDDQWHHIIGTYDREKVRLFVDGVEVGTGTSETRAMVNSISDYNQSISKSSYHFNGSIDSVRIYNRALPAAEVKQLCHDPFCNMLRVPVRYVPAAPAGLPIPVAMNYYRRRRVA